MVPISQRGIGVILIASRSVSFQPKVRTVRPSIRIRTRRVWRGTGVSEATGVPVSSPPPCSGLGVPDFPEERVDLGPERAAGLLLVRGELGQRGRIAQAVQGGRSVLVIPPASPKRYKIVLKPLGSSGMAAIAS
jgi:hypothetical protein